MAAKKRRRRKSVPKSELQNKPFWAIIGVVFIVSFLAMMSMSESKFIATGNAIQPISFVKDGASLELSFREIYEVKSGVVFFTETVKDSKIVIEKEIPPLNGVFVTAFSVTSGDAQAIDHIDFVVRLSDEQVKRIGMEHVAIYQNGKKLDTSYDDTSYDGKNEEVHEFSATATELGSFIVGKMDEHVVDVTEPVESIKAHIEVIEEPVVEEEEVVVEQPEEEEKGFWARFFGSIFG